MLLVKYHRNSFDRRIFTISLDAPLNVFALFVIEVAGSPLRHVNLRKASIKVPTVRFRVSSKCTALVVALLIVTLGG